MTEPAAESPSDPTESEKASQTAPAQTAQTPYEMSAMDWDEMLKRREKALNYLMDQLKPWLLEFGNWIFGGLIAFNLVVVAPLLTIGPGHLPILIAITTFICALPLNVSGLFVLKLTKDMSGIGIDDVMRQAFKTAELPTREDDDAQPEKAASVEQQRINIGLHHALWFIAVSGVLTLTGLIAALWFIAWWVAGLFCVVAVVALVITLDVLGHLIRPTSDQDRARRQRELRQLERSQRPSPPDSKRRNAPSNK